MAPSTTDVLRQGFQAKLTSRSLLAAFQLDPLMELSRCPVQQSFFLSAATCRDSSRNPRYLHKPKSANLTIEAMPIPQQTQL